DLGVSLPLLGAVAGLERTQPAPAANYRRRAVHSHLLHVNGDIPGLLAKGDGAGDVRVPAPAPWVCSELAFRRALRWVESPEYGRRSLLHDSIVVGLAVSTCHDPCRGRLRAL